MERLELCSTEQFLLNKALSKMVLYGLLLNTEREELLHKAKLLKLEDGKWKDSKGSILILGSPETTT